MLSGKLTRRLVWGPPNYGEDPKTDSQYHLWFLELDHPISVATGRDFGLPEKQVSMKEIQLSSGSRVGPPQLKLQGAHVLVAGRLDTQMFPTDRTPAVIDAASVTISNRIACGS